MDPASASVAFIGFAASVATLAGLVVESAQTLTALYSKLDHAPEDLKRFLSILHQHETILFDLRTRVTSFTDDEFPHELRLLWQENIKQMKVDYTRLKANVKKIETWFQGGTVTKKSIRARVRTFFSTPEMLQLQTQLRGNVDQFEIVLSMINEYRLRKQKDLLSDISQNVMSTSGIQQSKLEQLSSQTSRNEGYLLQQAVQLSGLQHQLRFISAQLRRVPHGSDYVFRECRFQGAESDHSTRPSRLPWSCLSRHLSFLTAERGGVSLVRHYWFGTLHVQTVSTAVVADPSEYGSIDNEIHFQFTYVAPSWLSDMLITISLRSSAIFTVRRAHVNKDPRPMDCLATCDVRGLRALFSLGAAHPLDLMLDDFDGFNYIRDISSPPKGPPKRIGNRFVTRTLLEAFHHWSDYPIEGQYCSHQSWFEIYQLLLDQVGSSDAYDDVEEYVIPISNVALTKVARILEITMLNRAFDQRGVIDKIIERGVDLAAVLNRSPHDDGNTVLLLLYAAGPRSFVHDFARRHVSLVDYWEMNAVNSWLLRTMTRSDQGLHSKLMSQYREMNSSSTTTRVKRVEPDFTLKTQLEEMRVSNAIERNCYLSALCAGGTAADIELFIANPANIPELDSNHNGGVHLRAYLEISAATGNRATFQCLIEAGADTMTRQIRLWERLSGSTKVSCPSNNRGDSLQDRTAMAEMLLRSVSPSFASRLSTLIARPFQLGAPVDRFRDWYLNASRPHEWFGNGPVVFPNTTFSRTIVLRAVLTAAVEHDDWVVIEIVLQEVEDVDFENENGLTPLMMTIILGLFDSAEKLVALGADVEGIRSCGFSAKHLFERLKELFRDDPDEKDNQWCDVYDHKKRFSQEFGGTVVSFLEYTLFGSWKWDLYLGAQHDDSIWVRYWGSWRARYGKLGKSMEALESLVLEAKSKDASNEALPKISERLNAPLRDSQTLIAVLVVVGYVVGILAHIGYDTRDSLNWIAHLPPAALRILVLGILAAVCVWSWKALLAYWSSSVFHGVCFAAVLTVAMTGLARSRIKKNR